MRSMTDEGAVPASAGVEFVEASPSSERLRRPPSPPEGRRAVDYISRQVLPVTPS
jgi:hypothetical protein